MYNLGTGRGCSVLDLVNAFKQASGVTIPYVIEARRPGGVAVCYSDPSKANRELGWHAEHDIYESGGFVLIKAKLSFITKYSKLIVSAK